MSGDLPAQLASDRTASACDQNHFSVQILKDLIQIHLDRLSSQQVLDCNLLHVTDCNLSVSQLVYARQNLQFTACLLTDI